MVISTLMPAQSLGHIYPHVTPMGWCYHPHLADKELRQGDGLS